MRREGGGGGGVSAIEYSCAHGSQISYGDLTLYLTMLSTILQMCDEFLQVDSAIMPERGVAVQECICQNCNALLQ
jgi:hypothetical protein